MAEHHTILGGKVHVYKRPNSSSWQCATYLAGRNRRTTTKEDSLSKAKEFAEDWYLQLRGKLRDGELKTGKLFRDAAKLYLREFDIMTQGQRSAKYASGHRFQFQIWQSEQNIESHVNGADLRRYLPPCVFAIPTQTDATILLGLFANT
jgi:hypothetical protein